MKGTFRYMFEVLFGVSIIIIMMIRLSSVLSMNAAVSASVVLASRLSTNVSVFALVLFSILSFALFPILRRRLQVELFPKNCFFLSLITCSVSHHVRMRYGYLSQWDFGYRLFF